jgi:hypothetical protein
MKSKARAVAVAETISANAHLIRELHTRIHETLKSRDTPEGRVAWERACAEFHSRYDDLAFPGGYERGLKRIAANDAEAIDTALAFLELRPYFFRSGYMRTKLLRLLKRATLTLERRKRLEKIVTKEREWKHGAQQGVPRDALALRARVPSAATRPRRA